MRCFLLLFLISASLGLQITIALAAPPTPVPQPIETDRLAEPILPENPSLIDLGNHAYYINCMPCHGDQGQGLTEEFRNLWVEDHRNCWARGCHGGRPKDEGFPIPRFVPGVKNLDYFPEQQALFNYLKTTHPPQRPGRLTDEEYWSLTVFLFYQAGKLSADQIQAIENQPQALPLVDIRILFLLISILALILIFLPALLDQQIYRRLHVLS